MKIGALFIVHYGLEWLRWAIRSVMDSVDGVHVFYTETPSHGHQTSLVCPESRYDIMRSIGSLSVNWHDCGPFEHEGYHRDYAEAQMFAMGYDSLLIVDADELWEPFLLKKFIEYGTHSEARMIRVGMRHFWRSLKWVCDDECAPHRMTNKVGTGEAYYPMDGGRVFHMGYAQSVGIINYKIQIHGHRNEWRENWWNDKFMSWKPGCGITDVHPTNKDGFWDPKPYADDGKLAFTCGDHTYWNMELIE